MVSAGVGNRTRAELQTVTHGHVAEWLRSGLQNRLPRFNSGRGLHARALPHKGKGLFLEYVGVRESWRGRGIFPGFMKKLKANGVPLTASVLHGNKSGMVDRFVKQGFTKGEADHKETKLSWA
jgi:hypothetical protein